MHELAITQSMFDIVLQQAEQAKAKKVTGINLVIGGMTGVIADSVQFYLDFLSRGTIAEGASVRMEIVPAKARCLNCKMTFELKEFDWVCPECGNSRVEIIAGNELLVESIEVE
ncbi:MAG: hydrogenase maturation nickel metallochaperone HypA [Dehalococcoidales bacterium]|nr:hydrogenase maturation nickel metallochaperone HypA [Dehalococcoidales bacterium]